MMKRARLALLLLLCGLLAYVMLLKRHYSAPSPAPFRLPPHLQSGWPGTHGGRSRYGVMFDGGSTGTRVHVFQFQVEDTGAPTLVHETFRAIKPGLSAYADDPQKCAAGLQELLGVARSSVPRPLWSSTPVVLKATAGLRLLPGQKAEQLLEQVRALFLESPFLSSDDGVSIMDGTDEGISAWITVNFLTGGLHGNGPPTVGMLDLGGGSTQITFSPRDEKTIQTAPIDYIRSFQLFNHTHTVYTHSYLGLGLMSARLAILGGMEAPPPLGGGAELDSPCLPPGYLGSWEHADVVYTVKGQKPGAAAYDACLAKVEKVLYGQVRAAPEVVGGDFYAFSFYYDRAVELGAIDEKTGGTVQVSEYVSAAKRVCGGPSGSAQNPFLCLDLVYISVLLQQLGFPPRQQLRLARTINQVETSWALGATFHFLQRR